MYKTRCKREAGESCRRINCPQKPRKVHLAPVPRRYNGVFYSWFHAPQPNRIAESLALPQKDHDASPAPRTDALTADDKGVTGDVIDHIGRGGALPSLLSALRRDAIQSTQFVVCQTPLPGNHALSPFLLRARGPVAGTHRWATSTRAVSGLGVETRGESGLPSMNRGTPCSGLAALWD